MIDLDDLHCPWQADILGAVPTRLALIVHVIGALALIALLR